MLNNKIYHEFNFYKMYGLKRKKNIMIKIMLQFKI